MNLISKHRQVFPTNQGISTLEVWHTFEQILKMQQNKEEIIGDVMEIGVLTGATISFLATFLEDTERVFLVDPFQNLQKITDAIAEFANINPEKILSFELDSQFLAKHHASVFNNYSPKFRFIHIDGEHSYDAVFSDIDLSYKYLMEGGLIVLDDIFNIASACCTHAMFDYLKLNPNLQCVAMGFNKGYLCHSKYLNKYRKFFLKLPELLAKEANLHVRLCFNSWGYERSYLTFHSVQQNERKYQAINILASSLEELSSYLDL